jgi:hypothetical protein
MIATVVDLRYRMKDVLAALSRREKVTILYHGRPKGTIVPAETESSGAITAHPFFGMLRDNLESPEQLMTKIRGGRYGGGAV